MIYSLAMHPESEALLALLVERTKLYIDVLKHLTTLSTGAIVLIATFIDKIRPTILKAAIPISIGLLLFCILSSTYACRHLIRSLEGAGRLRMAHALKADKDKE